MEEGRICRVGEGVGCLLFWVLSDTRQDICFSYDIYNFSEVLIDCSIADEDFVFIFSLVLQLLICSRVSLVTLFHCEELGSKTTYLLSKKRR